MQAAEHSGTEQRLEYVLATYPEHCVSGAPQQVREQEMLSMQRLSKCSKSVLTADLKNVTLATLDMVTSVALDVTGIVAGVTECMADVNPITIVICVVKDIVKIPKDIKGIIKSIKEYVAETKVSWPALIRDIKKCFKKGSDDYEIFLQNIIREAEICKRNSL